MTLEDIEVLPNGARFYRADLHIHSFGASHDVRDATMTPATIVQTAIAEKLAVIAVTDHNDIGNVGAALDAASESSLLVVPGLELSTPSGHLLCFLPTLDALEGFFGRLSIVDKRRSTSRCQTSMLDCLNLLKQFAGFGVLAHVDGPGGFEVKNPGSAPHKLDVLCHRALLGIEITKSDSPISYSPTDPDANRATCGIARIERLNLGSRQFLARLLNSDSHSLAALGRNAQGNRSVTRIKMDAPSVDALRIALEDSDARVRLEDQVPSAVPHVVGATFQGGFLDGVQIHFSPNLNCLIGGRGTGKSTAFEAVRCLTGKSSTSPLVDSEIWPADLILFWQDQAERSHTLLRSHGEDIFNLDDPLRGVVTFPIESYGQGETAAISKEAQTNPIALLSYLDRFVEVADAAAEEDAARDELLALQTDIEKAVANVEKIPQHERALAATQQQLGALEQAKAKDIIALQRRISAEREIRLQITARLAELDQGISQLVLKGVGDELATLATSPLAVGSEEFGAIVASARAFESDATRSQTQMRSSFRALQSAVNSQLAAWKSKEADALKAIDAKRRDLEARNIRLDMAYIQKLAKDEAGLKSSLANLRAWRPHLETLKRKRAVASKKRWEARDRIATIREAYGRVASETLKATLSDLFVNLKFLPSAHSPDAEQQIIQAMGWRTIQVPRAGLLIRTLTVPGLLRAIDKKDDAALVSVATEEGARIFDKAEATRIIVRLSEPQIRFALERCEVYDLPRLTVTRAVAGPKGKKSYLKRDFVKLSLGQQQSVLLALMLSSKSNCPLIIDQPEDNLDGEFIYHSLVPVLRLAKERRQVIIVTHNANIAVLGDAEQIIVLKSSNERGTIVASGSIDDLKTRGMACDILEGAKEAFQRRARIYGVT